MAKRSEHFKYICPTCRQAAIDVNIEKLELTPAGVDATQVSGICNSCGREMRESSAPRLDISNEASICNYMSWIQRAGVDQASYLDLCKARLCLIGAGEIDRATEYTIRWILARLDPRVGLSSSQTVPDMSTWIKKNEYPSKLLRILNEGNQGRIDLPHAAAVLELEALLLNCGLLDMQGRFVNAVHVDHFERKSHHEFDLDQLVDFDPNEIDIDGWALGIPVHEFLHCAQYAHTWQLGGVTCTLKALKAMSRMLIAFFRADKPSLARKVANKILADCYGIVPRMEVNHYFINLFIEVFISLLEERDYPEELSTSINDLSATLYGNGEFEDAQQALITLIRITKTSADWLALSSRIERNAIEQELRDNLNCADTARPTILAMLEIAEDAQGASKFHYRSLLALMAGKSQHRLESVRPEALWYYHPAFNGLGIQVARDALSRREYNAAVRKRIFTVWPEIAKPELVSGLEVLKDLGHDHTIELAVRLVQEERNSSSVKMIEIGDKISMLESRMREKLKGLYVNNKIGELNKLFSKDDSNDRESPKARMQEFIENMDARKISYGDVSVLTFVTFGELADQLAAHTDKGKLSLGKPMFKPSLIKPNDLTYHKRVVTAFRNAWAHHHPLESGFDKFEESYGFVSTWVDSLQAKERE